MADAVALAASKPGYLDANGAPVDPEAEKAAVRGVVEVLGVVLNRLVAQNDASRSESDAERVTRFHALRPPTISITVRPPCARVSPPLPRRSRVTPDPMTI